jgi:hypothetical protein
VSCRPGSTEPFIKASGLQQAIQADAIASFGAWALDIFQVEIDLEQTNVHHELVVRQSTVDQILPVPLFALLHRPVFDRLVDWLGFVVADRTRWRPPQYF